MTIAVLFTLSFILTGISHLSKGDVIDNDDADDDDNDVDDSVDKDRVKGSISILSFYLHTSDQGPGRNPLKELYLFSNSSLDHFDSIHQTLF